MYYSWQAQLQYKLGATIATIATTAPAGPAAATAGYQQAGEVASLSYGCFQLKLYCFDIDVVVLIVSLADMAIGDRCMSTCMSQRLHPQCASVHVHEKGMR